MFQTFSRGKASVGIDLTTSGGHEALLRLVETADVFLTNYLPRVRQKLRIDVDDLIAVNPRLVYARGSGLGPEGAEADTGGFDLASYWSRGGLAYLTAEKGAQWPPPMPGAAFGDLQSGLYAAGGVAAALLARERTGDHQVIDVSLLAAAIFHGLNGARMVVLDYWLKTRASRLTLTIALWLFGSAAFVYGLWALWPWIAR